MSWEKQNARKEYDDKEQGQQEARPSPQTLPLDGGGLEGLSSDKLSITDQDVCFLEHFLPWFEQLSREKVNDYLPSSWGYPPHRTALQAICGYQYCALATESVKKLLDKGANVHMRCLDGFKDTPLLMACVHSWPLCELLISHGADVNDVDSQGLGVYVKASAVVAAQIEVWENGLRGCYPLFTLAAQRILRTCRVKESPVEISSLSGLPREVKAKLEAQLNSPPVTTLSVVYGWIRFMPPSKDHLKKMFYSILQASLEDPGFDVSLADLQIYNCIVKVPLKGVEVATEYCKTDVPGSWSGGGDTWTLRFPSSATREEGGEETVFAIGFNWTTAVTLKGFEQRFAKEVMGAENDEDAAVCIIFLFGLNRMCNVRTKRCHLMFPPTLGFLIDAFKLMSGQFPTTNSWATLPQWYIDCGMKWMRLQPISSQD